ncbi:MAG: helix-turn-helix domain-containing protein [Arcobacteraceae bacterium]|nr:helix-turn-helix domain-containing protein [Arcobacteraceae bacterium]
MTRPTFEDFKVEALRKDGVKEEYELKKKLIQMRKEANLTQEQLAQMLHTKKSNISRLESFSSDSDLRISTLMAYAEATGHKLKIDFV